MSNSISLEEIQKLARNAIRTTAHMFSSLLKRNTNKDNKRVSLLSYWIKDYCKYILNEDSFEPSQLLRYKRGNIVQVEFGYRIGSELGGRHFAVVIDNDNSLYSDTITVVPLSSYKSDKHINNKYTFILERGLKSLYESMMSNRLEKINMTIINYNEEINKTEKQFTNKEISIDEYKKFLIYSEKKKRELKIQIAKLEKDSIKLDKLKYGTIANVGQIITISKTRISNPKINTDSFYGLKLHKKDLDVLNKKLKKLYIHE
ncbi:MAG: type II toxin-antitoxin system PemK/MazF family toxin [Ruminococcus sp.]|nr:type II toxin-antitoxin system PemK/MazF family toxin [Ruminococcus sp.]